MTGTTARQSIWQTLIAWRNERVASPAFQAWAARFPLTRRMARRDGARLFDLVSGFVYSQVLFACVELDIFERLRAGPRGAATLADECDVAPERMRTLLQAAASIDLLTRQGDSFSLGRLGAAILGVPGLKDMIRHHDVLYRDLEDPVGLLRGKDTELAGFWPYVLGGGINPETAETYSELMASSQGLVATETLDTISLDGISHLMDVGGGTGAFLTEVARRAPALDLSLFDLPEVLASAETRLAGQGMSGRIALKPGSFREGALPQGADAISLIRVLYDHNDTTVAALLRAAFEALPSGGRIIISEPMSGGTKPERAGDAYFAFYTMAMRTGRARSQREIARLLSGAGFDAPRLWPVKRAYVTSIVTATRP